MFKNKKLLITGGTGSFGNAVLKKFLNSDVKEIRVFSRDEKKQDDMRKKFRSSKLNFYIGDVRDLSAVKNAVKDIDLIFHAAALKQVPSCEFFPLEAVKTNVIGSSNVIDAAIEEGVEKIICLSTDKAVYPINAMGTSKAMMEKVIVAKSRLSKKTKICVTRYGNVMASRGSVIPLFINQLLNNYPLTVTNPDMTRFMMTLDDAVDLVTYAFQNGNAGDILVQKAPAATIHTLIKALAKLLKNNKYEIEIIGTRHGEKQYEALLTREERAIAKENGNYFIVPYDNRDLNYSKYISEGTRNNNEITEYNSNNTEQLEVEGMINLLKKLRYFKGESDNPEEAW